MGAAPEADADAYYSTYGYGLGRFLHHLRLRWPPLRRILWLHWLPLPPRCLQLCCLQSLQLRPGLCRLCRPCFCQDCRGRGPCLVKAVAAPAIAAPLAYHHAIAAPVATGYAQVNHATSLSTAGLAA